MLDWKSQGSSGPTLNQKLAVAAVALVSIGVFIYGFSVRDGDPALLPAFARRALQPARRPRYQASSSPLPTSPWSADQPSSPAGAPDPAEVPAVAEELGVPEMPSAAEAPAGDAKPHLETGAGTDAQGFAPGASPLPAEAAANPASPAAAAAAERETAAARAQATGASGSAAVAGRSLSSRRDARGRRSFGSSFIGGTGRFESVGAPTGATTASAPSVEAAGGAPLGGSLTAPAGAPASASGSPEAGSNGSGGGNNGGGSGAGGAPSVPPGARPVPPGPNDIASLLTHLATDAGSFRAHYGKTGLQFAVNALIMRHQEVAAAALRAGEALSAAARVPGIGTVHLSADKAALAASEKTLTFAISCLKALESEKDFPASASAAKDCHDKAVQALLDANHAELNFEKLRPQYPPAFDQLADRALRRGGANGRAEAKKIRDAKAQVDASLNEAVTVLRIKATSAPEKRLLAYGRKYLPAMVELSLIVRHKLATYRSLADSGAAPAGPHRDKLDALLDDAAERIKAANGQWSQVGKSPRVFPMLVTTASEQTIEALGDINAAEVELKALQRISAASGGTGSMEFPFHPAGYTDAQVHAAAQAQAPAGQTPHMVMHEGQITYQNGQPGIYVKYSTPQGGNTIWVALPPPSSPDVGSP